MEKDKEWKEKQMKGKRKRILKSGNVVIAEIVAYKIPGNNKLKNAVDEPE